MDWRREWKWLVLGVGAFPAIFALPVGTTRFDGAVLESLHLLKWYAREHVLLCLIPAFFIAGAIPVFVSQASVMKYLGAGANKALAYAVASVSGTVLAVCSCTVLPLFAALMVVTFAVTMSGSVATNDTERQARELEAMLIAPCCFSQQVSVHHSAAADEVRQDIRQRLAAGETQEQILDAYVAQYGKRILAQPPAEGLARMLYVLPPLALVLTAALVVVIVHRFTASRAAQAPVAYSTPFPVDERYRAELDEELRDLD